MGYSETFRGQVTVTAREQCCKGDKPSKHKGLHLTSNTRNNWETTQNKHKINKTSLRLSNSLMLTVMKSRIPRRPERNWPDDAQTSIDVFAKASIEFGVCSAVGQQTKARSNGCMHATECAEEAEENSIIAICGVSKPKH